jgi:hypothetical protein
VIIFIDSGGGGGGASSTTWSPTDQTAGWTLSNGDLTAQETSNNDAMIRATQGIADNELVYFEIVNDNFSGASMAQGLRLAADPISNAVGTGNNVALRTNGTIYATGTGYSGSFAPPSQANGDVWRWAVNRTTGVQKAWLALGAGGWLGGGDPTNSASTGSFTLGTGGSLMPWLWTDNNATNNQASLRADSSSWGYSAPSGYSSLP